MIELGFNITGTERYIWVACPDCQRERWVIYRTDIARYTTKYPYIRCRSCSSKFNRRSGAIKHWGMARERNPMWKGGHSQQGNGYIQVRIYPENYFYSMGRNKKGMGDGRYVSEHRLVMAKYLGRCLQEWEIVHHKNGIKSDNRVENLELQDRFDHIRAHGKGYQDGYLKGLLDGHDKSIKDLQSRVTILETENILLKSQLATECVI